MIRKYYLTMLASIILFLIWLSWFLLRLSKLIKDTNKNSYDFLSKINIEDLDYNNITSDDCYITAIDHSTRYYSEYNTYRKIKQMIYYINYYGIKLGKNKTKSVVKTILYIKTHYSGIDWEEKQFLADLDTMENITITDWRNYLIKNNYLILKPMKRKIYCYSKLEITKLLRENNFYTMSSLSIPSDVAIISINNTREDNIDDWTTEPLFNDINNDTEIFKGFNILSLKFKDDSEDFSPDLARIIIQFIKEHKRCDFLVHCIMGMSRSQAVCRFMLDTWSENFSYGREKENPLRTPNYHVLSTLKRVWRLEFEEKEITA